MDKALIGAALKRFVQRHQVTYEKLGGRQSQILELAATVGVSEHYRAVGFDVVVHNPKAGVFTVKAGTRGHPSAYSYISCSRSGVVEAEIHMNVMVRSAHDDGIYCVDVGLLEPGHMPRDTKSGKWLCLDNQRLISFAEVKKLVVYPMLLAQFVGIVHEIRPDFLSGPPRTGFGETGHLPPTLIALGHFSGNSLEIVRSFRRRGFQIKISDSFDIRLARCRQPVAVSPFYG